MIAPGALRESITFERPPNPAASQSESDGMGGAAVTALAPSGFIAVPGGPFRARIRPVNGRAEVLAQKLSGVQPFEILLRYCAATAAVVPNWRAINTLTGVAYRVTAVQNPDERSMWLSLLVKTGEPFDG